MKINNINELLETHKQLRLIKINSDEGVTTSNKKEGYLTINKKRPQDPIHELIEGIIYYTAPLKDNWIIGVYLGNNKHMNKIPITHFYEPFTNMGKDIYKIKKPAIIKTPPSKDNNKWVKTALEDFSGNYESGQLVENLPIFSEFGIGGTVYIPNKSGNFTKAKIENHETNYIFLRQGKITTIKNGEINIEPTKIWIL